MTTTTPSSCSSSGGHSRTRSFEREASAASTSYTASNPLHRRSSFPTSPSLELDSTGKTLAPSYFVLPPGIGLQLRGCDEGGGAPATFHFDSGVGVTAAQHHPATSSSRKSSASSSSTTSSSSCSSNTTATTLASSLTTEDAPTPAPYKRMSKLPAPGEDPQLAAARRALWEDVPEPGEVGCPSLGESVFATEMEEEEDEDSYDESSSEEEVEEESTHPRGRRSRSLPNHTTLAPLPSILRPPLPRTHSHGSSSSPGCGSTTSSVRISDAPPRSFTTFSPVDYERKGHAPVEKLSIREWIELQGVREAVGVWSGKIGKWEEGDEVLSASVGSVGKVEVPSPTTTTTAAEEEKEEKSVRERRSCGHLAAVVGVRTFSRDNSPVETCKSLFD